MYTDEIKPVAKLPSSTSVRVEVSHLHNNTVKRGLNIRN